MKTIKFLIVAVIFLVTGFLLGQSYQLPRPTENQTINSQQPLPITYRLQFSDAEMIEFQNVEIQTKETVLNVLKRLTSDNNIVLETKDYEGLGSLVNKIGEKQNGQENKYWQYFINDQYAQIGADQYQLVGDEEVTWKFSGDNFNQ